MMIKGTTTATMKSTGTEIVFSRNGYEIALLVTEKSRLMGSTDCSAPAMPRKARTMTQSNTYESQTTRDMVLLMRRKATRDSRTIVIRVVRESWNFRGPEML